MERDELEPGSETWRANFQRWADIHGTPGCGWGDCNLPAVTLRLRPTGVGWLPVCAVHRRKPGAYRRYAVQETVLYEVTARSEQEALDMVRDDSGRDCWVLLVTDRRIVDVDAHLVTARPDLDSLQRDAVWYGRGARDGPRQE